MLRILIFATVTAVFADGAVSPKYCDGPSKGWHKFENSCYLFQLSTEQRLSYYDAEDYCRSKGGHLVSILSTEENDFITETLNSHFYYGNRLWIGLNVLQGEKEYQWSDGEPFQFQNFIDKKQYKKESCYILYGKKGWRPEHCGLHYTPICKRTASEIEPSPLPPLTPDIPEGNCPADWIQFDHRCYKYFSAKESEMLTFKEAQKACISLGENHDLVSIHSMEEQAFLTQQLYDFGAPAWIGFRYIESDEVGHDMVFGWTDNTRENFTYWTVGHPPRGTWKYCAYLEYDGFGKGLWTADWCELYKRGYICQRPPDVSIPEPTKPPVSDCGKDSVGFRDSCYRYFSTAKIWDDAEKTCQENGGHLVTVSDGFEQNFLYGIIDDKSQSLWTGLKNVMKTRIFKWSNGEPLYYSNWAESPDVSSYEFSCISTSAEDNLVWNVEDCETEKPFICENSKVVPDPIPEDIVGGCASTDVSWIDIGDNYCYQEGFLKTQTLNFGENSRYCLSKGMEMVSLHSEHQTKSLVSYLWNRNSNYYLGLIRSFGKDSFIWTDGSSLNFTKWAENQPSERSRDNKEDCVVISTQDLKWYPIKCDEWAGYLCKTMKTVSGPKTRVSRSKQSNINVIEKAASAVQENQHVSQSSGPVSLLIAAIVCVGLSIFVAALVFAWRSRNDVILPTSVYQTQLLNEQDTETCRDVERF